MDRTTSAPRAVPRWPLWVSIAAVVIATTVAVVTLTGSDELPVIRLAAPGATGEAATLRADAAMDTAPAYAVTYDFELADTARFPAGEGTAYRLEPPADLEAAVAGLATRFAMDAEVEPSPFGDGAYQVGAEDGSGPSLWVAPSGDWNFNDMSRQPQVRCVETEAGVAPDADVETDAGVETEGGGSSGDPGDSPDVVPDEPCERATPPTGVPDDAAARQIAESFLAGLELPGTPRITEVYADEWGAWVSATLLLDGADSDLHASVGLGGDAVVTSASATLARPVEAGLYPTIDAQAAVDRLQTPSAWSGAALGLSGGRVPLGDVPVDDMPVDSGATRSTDLPDQAGVTDDDLSILPVPDPDAEPEVRTVTLVAAEPATILTFDADQSVWLLPGVRFTDVDGSIWQVLTVADEYLDEASPDAEPTPMPIDPEPGPDGQEPGEPVDREPGGQVDGVEPDDGSVPVAPDPSQPDRDAQSLAEAVIGLAEPDAIERIESTGLVARVVARDGEGLAVTDDLRTDRINLHVEDGTVAEASVG